MTSRDFEWRFHAALRAIYGAPVCAAHRRYQPARSSLFDIGQTVMPKLDDFGNRLIRHERVQLGDEVIITADVDTCEFMATVRGRRIDL